MKRLPIKTKKEVLFVDFKEIVYIEKFQRKTIIHTTKQAIEVSQTLSNLFDRLDKEMFIRSHKSYIVNINHIKKIVPWGDKTYRILFKGSKDDAWFSYQRYRDFFETIYL